MFIGVPGASCTSARNRIRPSAIGSTITGPSGAKKVCMESTSSWCSASTSPSRKRSPTKEPASLVPTSLRTVLCAPSAPITQGVLTCSVDPSSCRKVRCTPSIVLGQRDQLDTALDGDPERLQVLAQHALGLGLRRGQRERERAVDVTERDAEQLAVPGVQLHRGGLDPGAQHLVDDAHPVEHVQAAGVHRDGAGLVGGLRQLVDHPHADAAAGEFAAGDQAHGAGADDDDVGVLR